MWFSPYFLLSIIHRTMATISRRSHCLRVATFYFDFFDQRVLRSGYYPNFNLKRDVKEKRKLVFTEKYYTILGIIFYFILRPIL